jgi:hypothetical protein
MLLAKIAQKPIADLDKSASEKIATVRETGTRIYRSQTRHP